MVQGNFEKREKDKWTEIAKEFNLSGIILPKDWKISLKETFLLKNIVYIFLNNHEIYYTRCISKKSAQAD